MDWGLSKGKICREPYKPYLSIIGMMDQMNSLDA